MRIHAAATDFDPQPRPPRKLVPINISRISCPSNRQPVHHGKLSLAPLTMDYLIVDHLRP
eukprot:scaffold187_cov140-Skeletonema_marinoi.AAC.13